VDLRGYDWSDAHYGATYASNALIKNANIADGVLLFNGERLPDNGLSIGTPNNVFIKGNYNLDPDGDSSKNRIADLSEVISYMTDGTTIHATADGSTYTPSSSGLLWQPAEIITTRSIYTLSENFAEPQKMPLLAHQYYQYYDHANGYTDVDVVANPRYGSMGESWMPSDYSWSSLITQWSNLSGVTPEWSAAWIEANWGAFDWGDPNIYSFNTSDSNANNDVYIRRGALKEEVYNKAYSSYISEFTFNAGRSSDAAQLANPVAKKHIYNAALVTPTSTDPYVLERWGNQRIINGAFIKLPSNYALPTPGESYCGTSYRYVNPTVKTFNYESRFGRGSSTANQPRAGLTFGAESSWREITAANF
jgi:hypothetical protein